MSRDGSLQSIITKTNINQDLSSSRTKPTRVSVYLSCRRRWRATGNILGEKRSKFTPKRFISFLPLELTRTKENSRARVMCCHRSCCNYQRQREIEIWKRELFSFTQFICSQGSTSPPYYIHELEFFFFFFFWCFFSNFHLEFLLGADWAYFSFINSREIDRTSKCLWGMW